MYYEPYPPHPDEWATHPGTHGLPSWDHAYGYHQPVAHDMVSAIPLTLAAEYPVGSAIVVDSMSLTTLMSFRTHMPPQINMWSQHGAVPRWLW